MPQQRAQGPGGAGHRPAQRPMSKAVYRRRRLVVFGLPLVIIAVVIWLALRGSGSDTPTKPTTPMSPASAPVVDPAAAGDPAKDPAAAGDPAKDPAAGSTPNPTTSTAASGPQNCVAAALAVTLQPDAASYGSDAKPVFTLTIANTGKVPCLVDAGDAQREVVITSGPARVWSSRDCSTADTQSLQLLLNVGQSDQRAVQWGRTTSVPGCPAGSNAGAGTYSVSASLLGVVSAPTTFVLN